MALKTQRTACMGFNPDDILNDEVTLSDGYYIDLPDASHGHAALSLQHNTTPGTSHMVMFFWNESGVPMLGSDCDASITTASYPQEGDFFYVVQNSTNVRLINKLGYKVRITGCLLASGVNLAGEKTALV